MKIDDIVNKSTSHFNLEGLTIEDLKPVRERLKEVGYNEKNLFERLKVNDIDRILFKFTPVYLRVRMKENTPLDRAIQLFILARTITRPEAEELFDSKTIDFLIERGLLAKGSHGIFSPVDLFPCLDGYFAADHLLSDVFISKHVYPPGRDSYSLARGMIKEPVDSVLDLCTGSGIQGITAAAFAKRVVLVDLNPRALNFARFNALLNGRDNVEFRRGDLYEAVKGEKFDRIFANPPFVPSPENSLWFRDGGDTGEYILEKIVAGAPDHLKEGGIVQIVTLLVFTDEEYNDKVKRWLNDRPFHILTIANRYVDVEPYVANHMDLTKSYSAYAEKMVKWVNSYEEAGIEKMADGLINLMKADKSKAEICMKEFRIIVDDFSDYINSFLKVSENFEDDDYYKNLLTKSWKAASDVEFTWQSLKAGGEINYGVLFSNSSFNVDEELKIEEKEILDCILKKNPPKKEDDDDEDNVNGIFSIKAEELSKGFRELKVQEASFKKSFMNLVRLKAVIPVSED